jgi:hypothetical protein
MKRKIDAGRAVKAPLDVALSTPSVPIPPPNLLERAKKLGAISAGPAKLVAEGAVLAAVAPAGEIPRVKKSAPAKAKIRRAKR